MKKRYILKFILTAAVLTAKADSPEEPSSKSFDAKAFCNTFNTNNANLVSFKLEVKDDKIIKNYGNEIQEEVKEWQVNIIAKSSTIIDQIIVSNNAKSAQINELLKTVNDKPNTQAQSAEKDETVINLNEKVGNLEKQQTVLKNDSPAELKAMKIEVEKFKAEIEKTVDSLKKTIEALSEKVTGLKTQEGNTAVPEGSISPSPPPSPESGHPIDETVHYCGSNAFQNLDEFPILI